MQFFPCIPQTPPLITLTTPNRHIRETTGTFDKDHKVHTFSIGIAGSPDLVAARQVSEFLGTEHHEFTFTVQEGVDALEDLIWHIESIEQVCVFGVGCLAGMNAKKDERGGRGSAGGLHGCVDALSAGIPSVKHASTAHRPSCAPPCLGIPGHARQKWSLPFPYRFPLPSFL